MSEPLLMPFQDLPFNGDTFICLEFLELKKKYEINIAIETGSCLFSTTKWLGENFNLVYTVEINEEYAKHGRMKIANMKNVVSEIGNSVNFIKTLSNKITKEDKCLFFLDAHWGKDCPLLKELDAIANLEYTQPPVICIHDFKTPNDELGYDFYNDQPFTLELIKSRIEKIYSKANIEFDYYYNEKALGAKRGIIYVVPKIIIQNNHS